MDEWLSWANAVVDEIDPLCHQESILDLYREIDTKSKPLLA